MSRDVAVVVVVPGASATPAGIGAAADGLGLDLVFVAARGGLVGEERRVHSSFGPLVEFDPDDVEAVLPRLAAHAPRCILTYSEGMVPTTARLAAGLGLPFHDPETMRLLTDKWAQRRRLAECGVSPLWSARVTDVGSLRRAVATGPGPLVLKPVRGQSSIDTYRVDSVHDIPDGVRPSAERPFVLEEFLQGRDETPFGDYVSVESVVARGEPRLVGVTGKLPLLPPFREQGHFVPSHLPAGEQQDVADVAHRAIVALGIERGLVHTELKLTAAGPKIIEVNGRMGGYTHTLYALASGVDLLRLGLAAACGIDVDEPLPAPRGVAFLYSNLPPAGSGRLVAVHGAERVREVPGVASYHTKVPPGTDLAAGTHSALLDLVWGTAPDHRAMLGVVDEVNSRLGFEVAAAGGEPVLWRPSRQGLRRTGSAAPASAPVR